MKNEDKPKLLSGGNPQIPKGDGDTPVQNYLAAMPDWKRKIGRRLDSLIVRTLPEGKESSQGSEVELALLWHRGPRVVPLIPLLYEVR